MKIFSYHHLRPPLSGLPLRTWARDARVAFPTGSQLSGTDYERGVGGGQ